MDYIFYIINVKSTNLEPQPQGISGKRKKVETPKLLNLKKGGGVLEGGWQSGGRLTLARHG
jgi:hypothetical protein